MRRGRRLPDVTLPALEQAAFAYLERYASSAENLRRVLMRRIERAVRGEALGREEGRKRVDAVIARLEANRLLDDAQYAEARARSLSRQGRSTAGIARRLQAKGVDAGTVEAALGAAVADGHSDLRAAIGLARKRRLGPFRATAERQERRERDMAVLGRAGFSFDIARKVIDARSADEIEE
ncbi:MAG: RecX family transcriptional regulator [Alphaproteobacteria bacterium]|nr:RecX family transcriptional regulator [Alphaproteobacteria bacterium]